MILYYGHIKQEKNLTDSILETSYMMEEIGVPRNILLLAFNNTRDGKVIGITVNIIFQCKTGNHRV